MNRTILVADDEPDIRLLAKFMLEPEGFDVLQAGTGRECLDLLQSHDVHLILLDVRMPDLDGWDVLKKVRAEPEHARLPIVMMSAHASGSTRARAKESGSDGYVIKPFRAAELLDTIVGLALNPEP